MNDTVHDNAIRLEMIDAVSEALKDHKIDEEVRMDIVHRMILKLERATVLDPKTVNEEAIEFASYLVGHDKATILQMYSDWKKPSSHEHR